MLDRLTCPDLILPRSYIARWAVFYSCKVNPILLVSALCGAAWFVVDGFVLPPNFGGIDIYYFKDAGINFAQGRGFVTRFTFGNPSFEYQAYATYPPVYPLLFGFFVKLFGTSAFTNQIFNSAVSFFLGAAGFLALKPLALGYRPRRAPYILAAIFASAVFIGFFFPETDRPDGLGVCFGLLALMVLNRGASRQNEFVAGALCGIALVTSPFAGIWASIALALVVVARHYPKGGLRRVPARLSLAASGALLVVMLVGTTAAAFLPGWFPSFLGVLTGTATHNETGGGYFLALLKGDFRTWASGFPLGLSGFYIGLAKLFAVQGALAGAIVLDRFRGEAGWHGWPVAALLAASPLCLISSPYQANYPPMTSALLLGAAASMTLGMPSASRRHYATAIATGFALVSIVSFPFKSREVILRAGTRPSLERALNFIDRNRTAFDRADRFLAVSPATYILWRQEGIRPLTSIYSGFDNPENRRDLAYVALSYPGSRDPLAPQRPDWLTGDEYRLEYQPDLPQLATIFGWTVSHSSQTWESAIYARR